MGWTIRSVPDEEGSTGNANGSIAILNGWYRPLPCEPESTEIDMAAAYTSFRVFSIAIGRR